ncbi:MAG: cofactor-independent phosphoglycerate mutase [Clostridia bacterium]|nr:cofactor-independent phosphoglycerate mutase [Clostridia bacterium]
MKYVVILCDGMADLSIDSLGGRTPMQAAKKPTIDRLAEKATVGMVRTVANGMKPGSDVANLSVMGFDPAEVYTGRSPLEAASIGIDLNDDDVAIRCNLVTLSDEPEYEKKTMVDYCGGDISTAEADELIKTLQTELGGGEFDFYTGVAYRHCTIWHGGRSAGYTLTPPHDISGRVVGEYLQSHIDNPELYSLMKKSVEILSNHPINKERVARGERPANSIWLWGQGTRAALPAFEEKYGIKGAVISAVDLLKGIAKSAKMESIDVDGATGYIDTNFEGKTAAAIKALDTNDYVYVHIEAPDECGHRCEAENKVKAIELIDQKVVAPIVKQLDGTDYRMMILPDHPTPIATATHSSDPVPFMIYDSTAEVGGVSTFTEENAASTGVFVDHGPSLINQLIK